MTANQIVPITDVRKYASKYLKDPKQTFFVVVNNRPKTIIQPVEDFEKMQKELIEQKKIITELKEKLRLKQEANYVKNLHNYVNSDKYESYGPFNSADEMFEDNDSKTNKIIKNA
ncbi:type II toxin-antitoxin system Phd/YefM family antitoxin [Candidatus Gracilibacteria bacterium]|nr:type II toxin-antitoxin system Phd/YefM family antitoxin [Candidatus Gracilibacteria bacterium]